MVEEAEDEGAKKKRGPRGGIKHKKPGRGHATHSGPPKKRRIAKNLKEKHRRRRETERRREEAYKNLSKELQRLLKPEDLVIPEEEEK